MDTLRWQSAVDFVVLAAAFYFLLLWAAQARAVRIALGIVALFTGAFLAREYDLMITSWVLSAGGFVVIAVLLIVFQSELRRAVMRVDSLLRLGPHALSVLTPAYRALSEAAFALARARVGALIVLVGRDSIAELVDGGVPVGADISRQILEAIFQKVSPLHDGAVVIEGDRIKKANVVLPLTQRTGVPEFFGTRHRAAMGMAERSDALVVAVSEERGAVTLMQGRAIRRIQNEEELVNLLKKLQAHPKTGILEKLWRMCTANLRFKSAAIGLAALVWSLSFLATGTSVRVVSIPVEFSNVPSGMEIARQSATSINVQLRGNRWLLDSSDMGRLAAHFDLSAAQQGNLVLQVAQQDLNLPPGIVVEKASPRVITLHLKRRSR